VVEWLDGSVVRWLTVLRGRWAAFGGEDILSGFNKQVTGLFIYFWQLFG